MAEPSMHLARAQKVIGAVGAVGLLLGGLVVVAPDADAQAYGEVCDVVLDTTDPSAAADWYYAEALGSSSMGGQVSVPVFLPQTVAGWRPWFEMTSTRYSVPLQLAPGKVVCVVGDRHAIINGTRGPDTIYGGGGNETINGAAGDDLLIGGGGHDVLIGKSGDDVLYGGGSNDILFGHGGRNDIHYAGPIDTVGDDTLNGGPGNDLIRGDLGRDLINGDAGDDCLLGGWGGDEIYGWEGDDTIGGGQGHDHLAGNDHNDVLLGGIGADTIRGNDGLDQIWGDSDLYDTGVEMTVRAATGTTMFGPTPVITANGRARQLENIFTSTGQMVAGRRVHYIDGWLDVEPNPVVSWPTHFEVTVPPGGDEIPAGTAHLEHHSMRATVATVELRAMTLIASGLATGQIFSMTLARFAPDLGRDRTYTATSESVYGDPLDAFGPILGPLVVPPSEYDTANSSDAGGIAIPMATAVARKVFRGDSSRPLRHRHKQIIATNAVAAPGTPMTVTRGVIASASYVVTTAIAHPAWRATTDIADGRYVIPATVTMMSALSAMSAPLVEPRRHAFPDSYGMKPGSPITYKVVTPDGRAVWQRAFSTVASTHVHITAAAPAPFGETIVPIGAPPGPALDPVLGESVSYLIASRPMVTPSINRVAEVLGVFAAGIPHFRAGHLEVAACNLDAPRMIDNAPLPGFAFGGIAFNGLGALNRSRVTRSSLGDLEVPLIDNLRRGGPGPAGVFLDWPFGVDTFNYDDDIRGGDADDALYGEVGADTVWGDGGDDTIFGEGDLAAYVLADAAIHVDPEHATISGVPTLSSKRKLPIGLERQYEAAAGADALWGNDGDDVVWGGPDEDEIWGGPDDDQLMGGLFGHVNGGGAWDSCSRAFGFVTECEIVL